MKTKFHYVQDPGHGWLKVPVAELQRLGIENNISNYSYIRDAMAYLEEDSDMKVFLDAREQRNEPVVLQEFSRNRFSPIRKYTAYGSIKAATVADVEQAESETAEQTDNSI
jgi:hypothetical protein